MKKTGSLEDLYIEELQDLYSAEKQLVKALPKVAKAASSPDLREAIEQHLTETEGHVTRLEKLFQELDLSPKAKKCEAMEGLIAEGEEVIEEHDKGDVRDAAIISAAQRIEHYEIAAYGTTRTFARQLGKEDAAELLQQTLDEEAAADRKLTEIAESAVNAEAAGGQRSAR